MRVQVHKTRGLGFKPKFVFANSINCSLLLYKVSQMVLKVLIKYKFLFSKQFATFFYVA